MQATETRVPLSTETSQAWAQQARHAWVASKKGLAEGKPIPRSVNTFRDRISKAIQDTDKRRELATIFAEKVSGVNEHTTFFENFIGVINNLLGSILDHFTKTASLPRETTRLLHEISAAIYNANAGQIPEWLDIPKAVSLEDPKEKPRSPRFQNHGEKFATSFQKETNRLYDLINRWMGPASLLADPERIKGYPQFSKALALLSTWFLSEQQREILEINETKLANQIIDEATRTTRPREYMFNMFEELSALSNCLTAANMKFTKKDTPYDRNDFGEGMSELVKYAREHSEIFQDFFAQPDEAMNSAFIKHLQHLLTNLIQYRNRPDFEQSKIGMNNTTIHIGALIKLLSQVGEGDLKPSAALDEVISDGLELTKNLRPIDRTYRDFLLDLIEYSPFFFNVDALCITKGIEQGLIEHNDEA